MTKFALPALILCIFGLFFLGIMSLSDDGLVDVAPQAAPAEKVAPTEKAASTDVAAAPAEKSAPAEQPAPSATAKQESASPATDLDGVRAELQRLSNQIKANSDKLAQSAAAAKDAADKTAQSLRDEVATSQAKLGEMLKASSASSEALAQRVDAMKKDIEQVKKSADEARPDSNISPGVALFAALVALVLGPFVAYKFTENQLATVRSPETQASRYAAADIDDTEPSLAPSAAAESASHHEAPVEQAEQASPRDDDDGDPPAKA